MEKMHDLRKTMKIMSGNLDEASKYAKDALKWRDKCKMKADWFKKMAEAHLSFNTDAKAVFEAELKAISEDSNAAAFYPGIKQAYSDWMADIIEDTAEVQALLAMYK